MMAGGTTTAKNVQKLDRRLRDVFCKRIDLFFWGSAYFISNGANSG